MSARRNPRKPPSRVVISTLVNEYMRERDNGGVAASFDYCFNYFRPRLVGGNASHLAVRELELSCLQLGFYLASWGMYRGSAPIRDKSLRVLAPVVESIAATPRHLVSIDADAYGSREIADILALKATLRQSFFDGGLERVTDTLVTKTMLGVFGCVPAYDQYVMEGLKREGGIGTFKERSLEWIGQFYSVNQQEINACRCYTIDFATGQATGLRYPAAKVMDAFFFKRGQARSR